MALLLQFIEITGKYLLINSWIAYGATATTTDRPEQSKNESLFLCVKKKWEYTRIACNRRRRDNCKRFN